MVGHPEADPAAVDEVLPDRVAPFGLTLELNVNRINKDSIHTKSRKFDKILGKFNGLLILNS